LVETYPYAKNTFLEWLSKEEAPEFSKKEDVSFSRKDTCPGKSGAEVEECLTG